MTWQRLVLCFEVLSPLHVGFLPNQPGTVVARTRCYVPGKSLWGAVVANITPRLYPNPAARDFRTVGAAIRTDLVFSYFYLSDGTQIFFPDYTADGLTWGDREHVTDREFRTRFIGSHVSTKIGKGGGAEGGSLHEIEFVQHRIGSPGASSKKVLLVGMVWVQEGATMGQHTFHLRGESLILGDLDVFDGIALGGERNYGFGRVGQVPLAEELRSTVSDGWLDNPEAEIPLDRACPLRAHLPYQPDLLVKGEIEIVAGREYRPHSGGSAFQGAGDQISTVGYCFVPGTRLSKANRKVRLGPWGLLEWV